MDAVSIMKRWQKATTIVTVLAVIVGLMPAQFATAQATSPLCLEVTALNFNEEGACVFADEVPGESIEEEVVEVIIGDEEVDLVDDVVIDDMPTETCDDILALNYNATGGCLYPGPEEDPLLICNNEVADNYNQEGECIFSEPEVPEPVAICEDETALNYLEEGECVPMPETGPVNCPDLNAINFDEPGVCIYPEPEEELPDSVVITAPSSSSDTLAGDQMFTAEITDSDDSITAIDWSITRGTCEEPEYVIAGNVGDFNEAYTYVDGIFSTSVSLDSWFNGEYCLLVDPREDGEAPDIFDTRDFTVHHPNFVIEGYKYEDTNRSGEIDDGDATLAGWTVYAAYINSLDSVSVLSTTTDANGYYYFEVPATLWVVFEEEVAGWRQLLAVASGSEEDYEEIIASDEVEQVLADDQVSAELTVGDEGAPVDLEDEVGAETDLEFCAFFVYERELGDEGELGYRCDFLNTRVVREEVATTTPSVAASTTVVPETRSGTTGTRVRAPNSRPAGQVLGAATSTGPAQCSVQYLTTYMRRGANNDAAEVRKLQQFLTTQGFATPVTGFFGEITEANVKSFQAQYTNDILTPWSAALEPTGYVFKLTRWKINNIVCPGSEALPAAV